MVSFEVLDAELVLAVDGVVNLLDDLGPAMTYTLKLGFDVVDKDGEGLRAEAESRWTFFRPSRLANHDVRIAEM
jgi:hypothetical protein